MPRLANIMYDKLLARLGAAPAGGAAVQAAHKLARPAARRSGRAAACVEPGGAALPGAFSSAGKPRQQAARAWPRAAARRADLCQDRARPPARPSSRCPWPCSDHVRVRAAQEAVRRFREEEAGGRLAYAVTGGSPIAPEVLGLLREALRVPIFEGYGTTETGPVRAPARARGPGGGRPLLEQRAQARWRMSGMAYLSVEITRNVHRRTA